MAKLTLRERFENYVASLAQAFADELQTREPQARFEKRGWTHPSGGGGERHLLDGGDQLERVWVGHATTWGNLTDGTPYRRTEFGLAVYPTAPTAAAFLARLSFTTEGGEDDESQGWYSGAVGMVPYYFGEDETRHFHLILQEACDEHHPDFYRLFKQAADQHYPLTQRGEMLGVGGVYFERLAAEHGHTLEDRFEFVTSVGDALLEAILPLLPDDDDEELTEAQRRFQQIRQGRIAEYLLQHDPWVAFSRQAGHPAEASLACLPPAPRWEASFEPKKGSPEAALYAALRPTEWLADLKS